MKIGSTPRFHLVMAAITFYSVATSAQTGRVGIGTLAPLAPLHVDSTVLFTGSLNLAAPAPLPITGAGTRLLWYPDFAAFRAGRVTGTQWDLTDIGKYSMALGFNTHASGDYSFATGRWSDAFGSSSAALGHLSRASDNSFAAGKNADASGFTSVALGSYPVASGYRSIAIGDSSQASGQNAVAIGKYSLADGYNSFAVGYNNLGGGDPEQWIPTDPLFEVGNGHPAARNNALTVLKNGRVGLGYPQPKETLEVDGAVRLGTNADNDPAPGTIRWNATTEDFEGYTGSGWKSLVKNKSWGSYTTNEHQSLLASDGAANNHFGFDVAIGEEHAIVGAPWTNDNGPYSGSAYVFKRTGTTWMQEAKLIALDGSEDDQFGNSVYLSGDYAIIGAPNDDVNGTYSGSAYIFLRSGTSWSQQAKILPSDGAAGDHFGYCVSISGDYAVVGSYNDDDNGTNSGASYIFVRSGSTWSQQAKLLPLDGAANDFFGYSVAISGDHVIVGAYQDDVNGGSSGSSYIFIRSGSTWSQQDKLLPLDGATNDLFGYNVAISENYAIVGAPLDDDNGENSGSAYVFQRIGTNWSQQVKLLPADGAAHDQFGVSVSISVDLSIIGANTDGDNGSDSGSAYVFQRIGADYWTQQVKLLASNGAASDYFGQSVSIFGENAIVGAYAQDENGSNSGSAYIFR